MNKPTHSRPGHVVIPTTNTHLQPNAAKEPVYHCMTFPNSLLLAADKHRRHPSILFLDPIPSSEKEDFTFNAARPNERHFCERCMKRPTFLGTQCFLASGDTPPEPLDDLSPPILPPKSLGPPKPSSWIVSTGFFDCLACKHGSLQPNVLH